MCIRAWLWKTHFNALWNTFIVTECHHHHQVNMVVMILLSISPSNLSCTPLALLCNVGWCCCYVESMWMIASVNGWIITQGDHMGWNEADCADVFDRLLIRTVVYMCLCMPWQGKESRDDIRPWLIKRWICRTWWRTHSSLLHIETIDLAVSCIGWDVRMEEKMMRRYSLRSLIVQCNNWLH